MHLIIGTKDDTFVARYRPGEKYKFIMVNPYGFRTDLIPAMPIQTPFASLSRTGLLILEAGYAWNGASGPAIDTVDFVRGSGGHDALYQFLRDGLLDMSHRQAADDLLYRTVLEDGMIKARAAWVYAGVRLAGRLYT